VKTLCITGCLGFIGSHFTHRCLELGYHVMGVDKCTYAADLSILQKFNTYKNFIFKEIDIKDMDTLPICDYVVNFAAESHVQNSIGSSDAFMSSNVLGTQTLLNLIKNKAPNSGYRPIFLHISTDEVYGDILEGAHTETDALCPSNPYSASKAAADLLVLAWARTYGLDYVILRPTNNYGIRQYPEKLIPLSVCNLRSGRKIKLHNQGTPIRNWLHVEDTVEAVLTIIDSGVTNEIYNVAGGFEQKNITTVQKIIKAYDENYVWEDHIDMSYNRQGQDVRYALDDCKLRNLGWSPKRDFDAEIGNIVEYFKTEFKW